ncbi:unnamed protein product [Oreochromis niloticus]|nr:unnamed protein product [Mustela putorius furo]
MGTQGTGRKRAPLKDRFSAEDDALNSIAREAEARLAAKRAARAEARDIRMRELERQQKEADAEKARASSSSRSSSRHQRGLDDDVTSVRSYRSDGISTSSALKSSRSTSSVYNDLHGHKKASSRSSKKDLLTGLYHDQRNYTSLTKTKPPPLLSTSTYRATTSSPCTTSTGLSRSYSTASIYDDAGLYGSGYSSRAPSEYSWYSSGASSTRSSPVSSSDDDTVSSVSQERGSRGRRDSGLDEKCDKQYSDYSRPSSRCATPGLSAATLASLGGTSSRRGSTDASSAYDPDTSLSELRESLTEVEEKYKKAMVSNAQLDNDKANLIYQVDTLKDVIEEMEEQMSEMKRELEEKSKDLERQKHTCTVLQHKQEELKEGIRQRDELIEQHGLVIIPDGTPNGDVNHESPSSGITLVSQEAAQVLESAGEGPLDVRLRKLAEEKDELLAQIRKLKNQLEEEKQKHSKVDISYTDGERMENGTDLHFIEMQRDANRQISEYKFKLSKAEQEMGTMEQNINRLEGQVSRYKAAADNAEKVEDELKAEKRKLQRELRTALDKMEEMEMTNNHLVKRLEKMKANRNALLSQQ